MLEEIFLYDGYIFSNDINVVITTMMMITLSAVQSRANDGE